MSEIRKILENGGTVSITNSGKSMLPLLREGRDIMIIKPLDRAPIKSDAVLFELNGKLILHRVTKVRADGSVITMGDSRLDSESITRDMIFGLLTAVKRDGKLISVDSARYKLYVAFVPVRRFLKRIRKALRHFLSGIYHKIKK